MAAEEIKLLFKTIAELTGLKKLHSHLYKTNKFIRGTTKLIVRLSATAKATGGALKSMGGVGIRVFSKLRNGLIAVTAAIAGSVREFTVYNTQMARAWTMMKTGVGGFIKMRRQVAALSGDMGVLKSELAGGLYDALSAGVPEDNVMSFLSDAAKAAVADGSDVATAVNGITNVLNAFKIPAEETTRVADAMFTTVKNGKTTFSELARHMSVVAPIASSNGVAFEQVLAAVATLTKQGTPTAIAMTQIRAAIIGLNANLGEGWSKTMTLQAAFGKMMEKAGGSQIELRKMTGTVEGLQGILGLTGKNARMAAGDLNEMSNSAGSMDEAFQKMDQFRHWPKLWQTVRGAVTRVGEVFDKVLAPVAKLITAQIAKWRDSESFFAAAEEKLVAMREHALNIWAALRGGGEVGNLLEGLGDIIGGFFLKGAELAGDLLLKLAPIIGELIGAGVKMAITAPFRMLKKAEDAGNAAKAGDISIGAGALYSLTGGLVASRKTRAGVRKHRARRSDSVYEDERASRPTGAPEDSASSKKIAEGVNRLRWMSERGAKRRASMSASDAGRNPMLDDLETEQAEAMGASARLRHAQGSGAGSGTLNILRAAAAREEADVRRIESALQASGEKFTSLADLLEQQNRRLDQTMQTMRSQIKNLPL